MAPAGRLNGPPAGGPGGSGHGGRGRGAGGGPGNHPRAPRRARWILAAFLAVPLIELIVLILVGQQIGVGWTILALLACCLIGAVLVKRESARTWKSLRSAVDSGRVPGREIADAALVLVGGLLLLFPGFVTDVVGLFLILPFTRPITRTWLAAVIGSRVLDGVVPGTVYGPGTGPEAGRGSAGYRPTGGGASGRASGDIIEGEIIDEDPPPER